ncbi:hypothetical protein GLAREA_00026 [Glarea lozoyensis ATCC 20868]|uniref:Uncharacterized protein n=1 Tax=Glarea lozoyensis (strain ATCC 20868 / MF5171) TaxID=1116229 RepID=S3DQY2_GLAL2|nr:uncharacterized protein GLAREA_00026 [Glarea lozoyensis ATCC 20868]EPE28868.1 hypothetical protein GLAREA_00026 [Glarea lozoyensis ATCC 20868]
MGRGRFMTPRVEGTGVDMVEAGRGGVRVAGRDAFRNSTLVRPQLVHMMSAPASLGRDKTVVDGSREPKSDTVQLNRHNTSQHSSLNLAVLPHPKVKPSSPTLKTPTFPSPLHTRGPPIKTSGNWETGIPLEELNRDGSLLSTRSGGRIVPRDNVRGRVEKENPFADSWAVV